MKTRNFTKISIFFLAVIIALNFGLFPKAKAAEIKLYYSDFEKSYTQYQAYYYADKFYNTFGDPSHSYANIYYSYMESDAELQNSIYNWELLHMAANPLQTITGEQWISMQDLYKLAIFDVLNVNYSKPGIFDIVSLNASDYVVGLTDVLTDSAMDQNMLAQMAVNSENLSDLKLALEANYMLEAASFLNNIAKGADNMLEAVTDCASYQAIAETDVHTIAILQAISNDSNNPVELRAAAQECIQYAALDRQAILNMVTADATVDSIRDLVLDAMWDKIASSIPVIGYANIALKGIIVISDAFFNLDKTYESYYYLKVTVELENALRRQMLSYQNDFLQNEDGVRAMRYLRVIDLFERVVLDGFDRSKELLQTQLSAPWYLIRDWFAAPDDESAIAACKAEIEAIDTYKNTKIDNFNKFYELSYQSYLNDYGPVVSWDISSDGSGRIGASLYQLSTGGYKLVISGSGTMQNFEGWTNVPWYSYCSNIDQIKIKSGITSIGDYAFYSCSDLSQITIPEGIVSIGQKAFGACESMMTFTVPASVNSISADAFDGCSRLTEIRVHESNATFSSDEYGVLFNKNKTTLIRCPEYFVGQYQIPDSVVTIGRYAFSDCDGLKDVCVPESVVTCGYFAFYSCDGLLSATVETKLFSYMFRMCPNLKKSILNISGRGDTTICRAWL